MATHKLLLLPGDGIGTEVMAEVKRLIDWLNTQGLAHFETEQGLVGGSAYDADKVAITDATMALAQASDAVIFGAVGGPNGITCRMMCVPKRACCACARRWRCSPTFVRRSAIQRLRMPRA